MADAKIPNSQGHKVQEVSQRPGAQSLSESGEEIQNVIPSREFPASQRENYGKTGSVGGDKM